MVEVKVHETWVVKLLNIGPHVFTSNDATNGFKLANGIISALIHEEPG